MYRPFVAPKFVLEPKRVAEIPFMDTIAANTHLCLVSSRITFPFRILRIEMVFTSLADNKIRHYWLTDYGIGVSTTTISSGENIFGRETPTAYFIGAGVIKRINCMIDVKVPNMYIKLHTQNLNTYAYSINATMNIQELT